MPTTPFHGKIPDDRLYCPKTDLWVQEIDGEVLIGATNFGLHLSGEIIAFTSKPDGANIPCGKGLGTIECHKTVLAVHAPISFRLSAGNTEAEERPALINKSPYDAGWMARGTATAWARERAALCTATAYRHHILSIDPEARFDD